MRHLEGKDRRLTGLWVLLGAVLLGLGVWYLRRVLSPIFFAFLIAYFLDPLVDRFEERRVPRALGIVILLVLVLGGMALFVVALLPSVVREVVGFAQELPSRLEGVGQAIEPLLREYGVEVPHSLSDLWTLVESANPEEGGAAPSEIAGQAASVLGTVGEFVLGGTASMVSVVGSALLIPVIAFYLLHDFDPMVAGIRDLVPRRYRPFVVDVAREVDEVLGQFVRGQLLVMLALGVLYSVAYSLVGIRLAIPIGIVAGLLSFIPYVGGASALILALLMCALSWDGWWQVGGVVGVYTVIQVLEGFVITPRIVGDKVGLPAIWVLIALMVGGELFGFLGVLLSVPAAAVVKIFVMRGLAYYRKSKLFLDGGDSGRLAPWLREEGLPDDPDVAAAKAQADEESDERAEGFADAEDTDDAEHEEHAKPDADKTPPAVWARAPQVAAPESSAPVVVESPGSQESLVPDDAEE
ncbi:MAG: AI-2E family transporter [Sandaracinaceae bacterium]